MQIYLKSKNGAIEVYLCPEEVLEDESPVKVGSARKDHSYGIPHTTHHPSNTPSHPNTPKQQHGLEGKKMSALLSNTAEHRWAHRGPDVDLLRPQSGN